MNVIYFMNYKNQRFDLKIPETNLSSSVVVSLCLPSGPSVATSQGLNPTDMTSSAHPDPGTHTQNIKIKAQILLSFPLQIQRTKY